MWKRVKTLFVYRNFFFLLQIQENIFFSRESPTNLRICYRSSDFFFFFSGHKKRKKIWWILNISEDFFFFEAEWKKKIPLFFPLHALNWNFMFKMKWKKVSHMEKKKYSHILGRKNYSVDKKVMVMVFKHEKTIRLCDRTPGSALCVSTLWPLALLGSWVSGPWVVALGRGVTADSRVLLADAIVLASMPTPEKRRKISTRSL